MTNPLATRPDPSEYAPSAEDSVSRAANNLRGTVLDMLESQIEEIISLVNGLAPGMEDKRYAPGKWSIRQIIGHLGDGERVFSERAFRFSRCDPTPLPGFEENDYVREAPFEHVPIQDLLAELVHLRRATIYLYRSLDEKALMRRGVANGIENSVRALAFVIAGHDHHHLEVLRERYLA